MSVESLLATLSQSMLFWVAVFAFLAALYVLPTFIGVIRGVERLPLLIVLNLFGGGTLIGWPAALFCAFVMPSRRSAARNRFYPLHPSQVR